jgi:biotin carboxyl carrier protein
VQYEIEVGGRRRHVVVHREGDRFDVSIDGRPFQVNAVRIDAQVLSLIVGAASFEVTVAPDAAPEPLIVRVGTTPVVVEFQGLNGRRRFGQRRDPADASTGPQRIAAPMPGKIVRVLVKTGEAVVARQPLVVVEAMKMENELRARRDGTIAEVHAEEGQSVEAGALLVVIQ